MKGAAASWRPWRKNVSDSALSRSTGNSNHHTANRPRRHGPSRRAMPTAQWSCSACGAAMTEPETDNTSSVELRQTIGICMDKTSSKAFLETGISDKCKPFSIHQQWELYQKQGTCLIIVMVLACRDGYTDIQASRRTDYQ